MKYNKSVYIEESGLDKLDFTIDRMELMTNIEIGFWKYIDNICPKYGLPLITHYCFMYMIFNHYSIDTSLIKQYCNEYNKYKKSIPTAGAIILYNDNILLVRITGAKVYSLPKGKKIDDESIYDTACREVKEETSLDLKPILLLSDKCISIMKTKLYVVKLDALPHLTDDYNSNEIQEVKWFPIDSIIEDTLSLFSKQVKKSIDFLYSDRYGTLSKYKKKFYVS